MATPVSVERFVKTLEQLKVEMDAGSLRHSEYDQRLARAIQELREKGLDADRSSIKTTIDELLQRGVITPGVKQHLEKRLGLA